jgi:hypothetical protein
VSQTTGRTLMLKILVAILVAVGGIHFAPKAEAASNPYWGFRERVKTLERDGKDALVTVRVKSNRSRARRIVCVTVTFSNTKDGYPVRQSIEQFRLAPGVTRFTTRVPDTFRRGWPRHVKSTCFLASSL